MSSLAPSILPDPATQAAIAALERQRDALEPVAERLRELRLVLPGTARPGEWNGPARFAFDAVIAELREAADSAVFAVVDARTETVAAITTLAARRF